MKKKSTPAKIVIKRLGRKSGNISAAKLQVAVRVAREKSGIKSVKALRKSDTATGSGHVRFVEPQTAIAQRSRKAA